MTRQDDQNPTPSTLRDRAPTTSRWEWVAAAFGAVLIVAMVGYLVRSGLTEHATVADIAVTAMESQPGALGHTVRFQARNLTSVPVASLRVQGDLRRGEAVVESAEVTFDYLPPYSTRYGGLFFRNDPNGLALVIAPSGYNEP